MPAKHQAKLSQPIFHEPIFSEDQPLPSPTGFETKHPSDTKTYDEVEKLLKKEVVGVPHRAFPTTTYSSCRMPTAAIMDPRSSEKSNPQKK